MTTAQLKKLDEIVAYDCTGEPDPDIHMTGWEIGFTNRLYTSGRGWNLTADQQQKLNEIWEKFYAEK